MTRFFCLIIIVMSVQFSIAQTDSVLYMNGKYKTLKVDSVNSSMLFHSVNGKSKSIVKGKIFSYQMNNQRSILYADRSIDYLTQPQMRTLIIGKQIGLNKYNDKPVIVAAFLSSLASSIFDTYESVIDTTFASKQFSGNRFFKREPTFAQLLMPLSFTFTITAFRPKLKAKHLSNQSYLQNELVIEGFQTTAKRKKFYGAMFSGVAGTLVGLVSYAIFK